MQCAYQGKKPLCLMQSGFPYISSFSSNASRSFPSAFFSMRDTVRCHHCKRLPCFVRRLKSAQTIDITGFILLHSVAGNGI